VVEAAAVVVVAATRPSPASVWPSRSSVPPGRAISGKTWPGLTISLRSSVERSAHWIVCTRSAALTPVLTPCAASIDCVNAVAWRERLISTMGRSLSWLALSGLIHGSPGGDRGDHIGHG
jgi:hypothetical protein